MVDLSLLARSVPESTLTRIGAVMVLWGGIEHHMDQVLWRLLEADITVGREVTVGMGFATKKRVILSLLQRLKIRGAACRAISVALKRAASCEKDRNLMAHALWFGNEDEGVPPDASSFSRRLDRPDQWGSISYGDERMELIIANLHYAHEALRQFVEFPDSWRATSPEIRDRLPALPKKILQ